MQFKILITPDQPTQGDLVLAAETPLSGVTFIEEVGKCLRRSIDHIARYRHITLGALAIYEITVPQQLAIDSGLFEDKSTISVIVENDLLSHYIFYGASVDQRSSGSSCATGRRLDIRLVSVGIMDWQLIPPRTISTSGQVSAVMAAPVTAGRTLRVPMSTATMSITTIIICLLRHRPIITIIRIQITGIGRMMKSAGSVSMRSGTAV